MRYLMTRPHASASRREGVVLLVVIAMLALFAAVALGFVFYADAEATAANVSRQAVSPSQADIDPELLAAYFLSQAIYDTDNIYSALRGWSFARSMYGNNPYSLNYTPYNGMGREILRYSVPFAPPVDNFNLINYQSFSALPWSNTRAYVPGEMVTHLGFAYVCVTANSNSAPPSAPWVNAPNDPLFNSTRMPEFYASGISITETGAIESAPGIITITTVRQHGLVIGDPVFVVGVVDSRYNSIGGSYTVMAVPTPTSFTYAKRPGLPPLPLLPQSGYGAAGKADLFRYVGGANAPWTAYDTNSLFLSQVAADGTVLMSSYERPWLANAAAAKYTQLRPHPTWNPQFPAQEDAGGDVRNLDFGPGFRQGATYANNDSKWIDLGYPIMTAPNGKRYKPLFAPLIMDLSNRLHLWAHGNRLGNGGTHASNQGWGPWEVNLSKIPNIQAAELQALFNYRYGGPSGTAASAPVGPPAFKLPGTFASRFDLDALDPSTGASSKQFVTGYATVSTVNVNPSVNSMTITWPPTTVGGFPAGLNPGMVLGIDAGNQFEAVQVATVTPGPGANEMTFTATANFTKGHAAGAAVSHSTFFPFPNFPNGWDNGTGAESTQNPLRFNIFNPGSQVLPVPIINQPQLAASHLEVILRAKGTNAPGTTSEIMRRMQTTFNNTPNGIRARNLVTLHSWHLDRTSAPPFLNYDRNTAGHYLYDTTRRYPIAQAMAPTDPAIPATVSLTNSEFTPDWRSNLGAMLRVNLNRRLTDYPPLKPVAPLMENAIDFVGDRPMLEAAIGDRQGFARDIYNALVRITGAQDPNVVNTMNINNAPGEYRAARYLAQLAVNIVDYIDNDDYNTPFQWTANEFVFGTELPRLLVNEVYAQRDNDNKGKGKGKEPPGKAVGATEQDLNVWAELHNPFRPTPAGEAYPRDGGIARMMINNSAVYHVIIGLTSELSPVLRDPDNLLGDPPLNGSYTTIQDWGNVATPQLVLPANGAPSGPSGGPYPNPANNQGFYVLGPTANYTAATDPNLPTTYQSAWMSMKLSNTLPDMVINPGVTVLLRRLANPHLPPQDKPGQPFYNPYVTVDYADQVPAADRRLDKGNGMVGNQLEPAYGRRQPYAAHRTSLLAQTAKAMNQPDNTFYRHNEPVETPFTWLTQLDRPLVNQLELLHVSGYKPHELTQQFIALPPGPGNPAPQKFQHYAPWADPNSRLYRALEVLGTPSNMAGAVRGGKMAGNINLNTYMEPEILLALADPQDATQPYVGFTTADVANLHARLITARNPLPIPPPPDFRQAVSEGLPFRGFGDGDMAKTFFRTDANGQVFAVGPATNHPYHRASLLQKVFNNVSTTSNLFAVWVTVGFFEVVDESVRPARLGPEIGRSENRHIRHRMFAIVDRSGLQLFDTRSSNPVVVQSNGVPPAPWSSTRSYTQGDNTVTPPIPPDRVHFGGATYVCLQSNTGQTPTNGPIWQIVAMNHLPVAATANGLPVSIQPGMVLEIGGINSTNTFVAREVVTVPPNGVGVNSFTAEFTVDHPPGSVIVCRGNPGPRTNYNPRRDSDVVLHLSVIK